MLVQRKLEAYPDSREYVMRMDGFSGWVNVESDFNLPPGACTSCTNMDIRHGILENVHGFGTAEWKKYGNTYTLGNLGTKTVTRIFELMPVFADREGWKNIFAATDDGRVYRFAPNAENVCVPTEIPNSGRTGDEITYFVPYYMNNRYFAVFGGPKCGPFLFREETQSAAPISSGVKPLVKYAALHYGRLFGAGDSARPLRLWYSAVDAPDDFAVGLDQGGYIDFSGELGCLIGVYSLFDSLLVFCKYGIASVYTLTQQSGFRVENIYYSGTEILEGSIHSCGQQVLFAAKDGVYSCNGSSVRCVSDDVSAFFRENELVSRECSSICYRGKYFLSLFLMNENLEVNTLLQYDLHTGAWQRCNNTMITSMALCHDRSSEKLLLVYQDANEVLEWGKGSYYQGDLIVSSVWRGADSDLGTAHSKKTLREILFSAAGDYVELQLFGDGKLQQTFTVPLAEEFRQYRIRANTEGTTLGLSFLHVGAGELHVKPVTFIYTAERIRE